MRKLLTAAVLTVGVGLTGAALARGPGEMHDRPCHAGHAGHSGHAGHAGHARHGAAHGLRGLDLSEDQRRTIGELMRAQRPDRAAMAASRSRRTALANLDPGAADYDQRVAEIADQAAAEARQRVLDGASLRRQVNEVLTANQRTQLRAQRQKALDQRAARLKAQAEAAAQAAEAAR